MPQITVEAVPATAGRPSQIKIASDLGPAEALALLERARAALLAQPIPALDGEPRQVRQAPPGMAARLGIFNGG